MAEKKLTLEETFEKLDRLISDMEDPELSLEKTFEKYTEGMKLIKTCNDSIDKIEQQLTILEENNL